MAERLFRTFGHHYILVMMVVTRCSGSLGGVLVVYYVDLILNLPEHVRSHFWITAGIVVPIALITTAIWALWETRSLRETLRRLRNGGEVDKQLAYKANFEAFTFPARHHRAEAWMVPSICLVPVLIVLRTLDEISPSMMANITLAVFMGIALALMSTYFMIEKFMRPVIRYLLSHQLPIDYSALPMNRLRSRLNFSFGILIVITALMIATLARQRGEDIKKHGDDFSRTQAIADMQRHSTYITLVAVGVGVLFSTALAQSVASRVNMLVMAMRRVEEGSFDETILPTSNDEIDILTRQFNAMVVQLCHNDRTIRDLNANLETKVEVRTEELRRSQSELQDSLKQLQDYDELKSAFFANVSHELRTPLTMILSPIDRLIDAHSEDLNEDQLSLLRVVQLNGQRLLDLISRLLEFSKLEAGKSQLRLDTVDINFMIEQLVDAAQPLADQRGVCVNLDLDDTIPQTGADYERLEIVITNLLSNALKFTPSGGQVEIQSRLAGDHFTVSVQDSGIGIAPENHHRVFERFVQIDGSTSRQYAGTGLGLPLAKEFVELHGGRMHLSSDMDQGALFQFDIPLAEPPANVRSKTTRPFKKAEDNKFSDLDVMDDERLERANQDAGPTDAPRVLVVDDTPEIRILLIDTLSDRYRVLVAEDGRQGLERALNERPDLIISDVMMPHMDGYEFCQQVKKHSGTRSIPFVMLTAKAEHSMKIEGLEHGADEYLVKPFDSRELVVRARNMLSLRRLTVDLDQRNQELELAMVQLKETQDQLIHSEKMSSLGQLVAGLAHEINNAINAVYNGIQPLQKRTDAIRDQVLEVITVEDTRAKIEKGFAKVGVLASVIEEGATRTARIVSDMKTFSHPGNEAAAPFDLHETLNMCVNLLASQIKNRITLTRDYDADPSLRGPRGQLGQVFMNILTNAQQAIEGEGEIHISTREEDDFTVVRIRDNGPGIDPAIISKVFDPFFTTKEPGIGTGLGLSISYGIVNRIGGSIQCQSHVGEGTEFTIRLPKTADMRSANTVLCLSAAEVQAGGATVS